MYFYVGTYGNSIYLMDLSIETGAVRTIGTTNGLIKPSYQAISKDNKYLYTVNESGNGLGGVSVFEITGDLSLRLINSQPAKGPGPCHISVSECGKFLLAAGYADGSISVYPILKDRSLGELCHIIYHEGKSVNTKRQNEPHAHCVKQLPGTDFVYVTDLGTDKINIYRLKDGLLLQNNPSYVKIHPGAGPRHLLFESENKYTYLINEVDNTVTVLRTDIHTGALTVLQDISTIPEQYEDITWCSAIRISADERFIYASNRGHDSITVFSRNRSSGLLTFNGFVPSIGNWPRDFNIDNQGKYLVVTNEHSDSLYTFTINSETGLGEYTGYSASIEKPACVTFLNI